MIKCPNCGQTIPASNSICQFCQKPIPANMRGPVAKTSYKQDDDSLEAGSGLPPDKVWKIYRGLATFWIVSAGFNIILGAIIMSQMVGGFALGGGLIFDLATVIIGVGLLLKNEWIRNAATFFCILSIIRGFLLLFGGMMALLYSGIWGVPFIIGYVITMVLAAAMIWAINETERLMTLERLNRRR